MGYGGAAPAVGGARESGRNTVTAPPFAGPMYSKDFPTAHVYAPASRARAATSARAATVPGHYGPQLTRTGAWRGAVAMTAGGAD